MKTVLSTESYFLLSDALQTPNNVIQCMCNVNDVNILLDVASSHVTLSNHIEGTKFIVPDEEERYP